VTGTFVNWEKKFKLHRRYGRLGVIRNALAEADELISEQ
jgi:hypothetical protein